MIVYPYLDKNSFKKLHKELWLWLSENLDKSKKEWPRWKSNGGNIKRVINLCFACEISKGWCPSCPIKWPPYEDVYSTCMSFIYPQYTGANTDEEKYKIAIQIANLEWK